jgi:hypothetical protein
VDLADRRVGQGPAGVRPAPVVAPVSLGTPVLDVLPPSAVRAAGAQLRMERVEHSPIQPSHGQVAKQRPDVVADVALVRLPRRRLDVDDLEVPGHELADRRPGPRVPPLVNLAQQAGQRLLRLALGMRARLDRLR